MTREDANKLLEETAARLSEHFDHVQILATWNVKGDTAYMARGAGNWYARQGMAYAFIQSDIAQDAAVKIAQELKDQDQDDDH